ncbi:LuxR family transcriptional regulator [Streptomyces sp. yr375]|uniref:helix-turn-helix transcriptional regulator n=1 Tax=Streptomyces sp. yr375 TaxID=1761906 RepID=UPI0015A6750E|nr:LuxR family transcriptional regulator [Streptomyces sp. yr375]
MAEREDELGFLTSLLDEAIQGSGKSALVSGVVATGKSVLLDVFAQAAMNRGALALTAIACVAERDVPMGVMSQLLLHAPLSPAARREADRLLAVVPEPDTGLDTLTAHAMSAILLELSEQQPLALIVDDIHLTDAASQSILSYFARRIRGARIATVFSYSEQSPHHNQECAAELLRQPHCHGLALHPLTPDGVARLAARHLGHEAPGALAERCHQLSNGNPLLAEALIGDHLAVRRTPPAPGNDELFGSADTYGQAVLEYLRRSDPQTARVAQGVAVLRSREGVARLLGMCPTVTDALLDGLRTAGLIDGDGFRHPAAAGAVLLGMDGTERIRLHQAAAAQAYHEGRSASEVAEQLLIASDCSAPWSVGVLTEAARLGVSEGRLSYAVACLKLARLGCADDPVAAARLQAALLRAEWRINPSICSPYLAELVEASHAGHLSGDDTVGVIKALLWNGRFAVARDLLPRLDGAARAADRPSPSALCELRLTIRDAYPALVDLVPGIDDGAADRILQPLTSPRRLDTLRTLNSVISQEGGQGGRPALERAERILQNAPLQETGTSTMVAGLMTLLCGERVVQAAQLCDALLAQSAEGESRWRYALLLAVRAEISLRQGSLLEAAEQGQEAMRAVPTASWGVSLAAVRSTQVLALTSMGRHREALAQLNMPLPPGVSQSRFGLTYLQARGRVSLATGHLGSALADFENCGELMGRWNMDVPSLVPWRVEAAAVLLEMGEHGRARKLAEEQLTQAGSHAPRAAGSALRVLAMMSDLRRRSEMLRQSADLLQGSGDRYELLRTLVQLTETHHTLGELRRARMVGRRAWNIARECHAEPLVDALALDPVPSESAEPTESAELVELQAAPTEAELLLSDAERRVAEMAALGYTNREISNRLYISVSTVEQHLTKTYRKLNVTRRSDLPSLVMAPTGS